MQFLNYYSFSDHVNQAQARELQKRVEPFIPTGDAPSEYRIAKAPREPIPNVALLARYVPLLAGTRKRRAALLEEFRITGNPRCISEIEMQAIQDIPMVEALDAIFGKGRANFRTFMAWEATRNPEVEAEMEGYIAEARDNKQELRHWRASREAVARFEDGGPWNKMRAAAIIWTLEMLNQNGCFPPRGMVKNYLRKIGFKVPATKNGKWDRRFFSGPVLHRCRRERPGGPVRGRNLGGSKPKQLSRKSIS